MKPVALITGGQQGIGLGIAQALKGAGFAVALAAELPPDHPRVIDALQDLGPAARYFCHDLSDAGAASLLLDDVERSLGPIACLVSNAGVPARIRGDMLDMTADNFDAVLGVNLRGTFFLAQQAARRMIDRPPQPYRSLIFITSVSATHASIERAEYCVSKAGAAMAAQLFALRLAPHGIGVFEIRPGIIETPMTATVKEKYSARIADGLVPAGRWGQPADVGAAVVPLALGQMAFSSGSVIAVDGGLGLPRL